MEHTDGLNDADEMNLYVPNPQADSPFGPADLEWLYRQQDVDGSSLVSRLAQLAPVSFTNPIDGQRRRRLFATDSWEMNNFAWANDNPGNAFPTNYNFASDANAGFPYLGAAPGLPTPSLAQRDKKINLNYPLPVSNDPNEPIRQKWISDAYQLMKSVLPPKAVDTPDELAALSQFLINVIDFRDPDCTMTHFRNPDVKVVLGTISGGTHRLTSRPTWRRSAQPFQRLHRPPGDPPGPVRHGVQPGRHQRGPGVLVPEQRRHPDQPLLRRAGQHPVPDGHGVAAPPLGRNHQSAGCLDARPVAGQLRHGDDRRRPGQPARPVHRPAPAHPDRQLLRPASASTRQRRLRIRLFAHCPATCSSRRCTRSGRPNNPPQSSADFPSELLLRDRQPATKSESKRPDTPTANLTRPTTRSPGPWRRHRRCQPTSSLRATARIWHRALLRRRPGRPRQAEHDAAEHSADRARSR